MPRSGIGLKVSADKVRPAVLAALEDGDNDIPIDLRCTLAGVLDQIAWRFRFKRSHRSGACEATIPADVKPAFRVM